MIKAEIERRRLEAELNKNEAYGVSAITYNMHLAEENLCMFLLSFIESLEKENDPCGISQNAHSFKELDEAAEEFSKIICGDNKPQRIVSLFAFKSGALLMAKQGESREGEVFENGEFIKFQDGTFIDLDPAQKLEPAFKLINGDKVIVQIRKK